jgi:hypothetical protein
MIGGGRVGALVEALRSLDFGLAIAERLIVIVVLRFT